MASNQQQEDQQSDTASNQQNGMSVCTASMLPRSRVCTGNRWHSLAPASSSATTLLPVSLRLSQSAQIPQQVNAGMRGCRIVCK